MKVESEMLIKFDMGVGHGGVARNVMVFLTAPQGFEFPDAMVGLPPMGEKFENYVSAQIELGDIPKGLYCSREIKLKAPPQPKSYKACFIYLCDTVDKQYLEFEIVVEPD